MFTGIVETTAEILEVLPSGLVIARPANFDDVKIGSSIAVSGVCLSIVELTDASMRFDVVEETFARSNLRKRKKGDRVNLERAMRADARLDGHIVQGHVEGTAEVVKGGTVMTIRLPESLLPSVLLKGSITVEGVSLTVASLDDGFCTIAMIPQTMETTTLKALRKGDRVNIETDVLAKYAHAHQ